MAFVRLTQLDGKLPNIALMRLSGWHRKRGDMPIFSRKPTRDLYEPKFAAVYGSAIFSQSALVVETFRREFPTAVVGGTWCVSDTIKVEDIIDEDCGLDYYIYPNFKSSIGFTQRGCRLKCGFCVVPKKEGKPVSVSTINEIWRGHIYPKHIHLLDNDFFGQPRDQWEARIDEIKSGGFKVCFNQGINIRMIGEAEASALGSIKCFDDSFKTRRLYTAWDNIGEEAAFLRGVELLSKHGVPPSALLVYMLIGYDKRETWERVLYRFNRMAALGIRPFPMIYGNRNRTLPNGGANGDFKNKTLANFQRWAVRRLYTVVGFEDYDASKRGASAPHADLFNEATP